jgi:cell fate (sporulation/competence/biofilm development) regulator YmcA (YheA/YmcA/DUF963 family)
MNAKQAIDKIAELLKFTFKSEKFYSTKLQDGTEVTNNLDEDFKIGQVLYVVGESTLTPAPLGSHITRENLKVTVDSESVIIAIESGDVIAEDAVEMTEAKDAQGQILESNTFDVGEKVYQVKEDGSKEPAPDGEHQVVLKDESGNENKIRIQVKDGVIIERSNVEEMSAMYETEESTSRIEEIINLLLPMVEEMKKMQSEMEKMKQQMSADISTLTNDFNSFKKSPEKFSVVEKKTMKESFDDYKLDLIKSLRK